MPKDFPGWKFFNSIVEEEARDASISGNDRELNGRKGPARKETRVDLLLLRRYLIALAGCPSLPAPGSAPDHSSAARDQGREVHLSNTGQSP